MREKAFSPLADDLPGQAQALGDDLVFQAIRGKEDELGPNDLEVRCRILACHRLELLPLAVGEEDRERATTGHLHLLLEIKDNPVGSQGQRKYVIVLVNLTT